MSAMGSFAVDSAQDGDAAKDMAGSVVPSLAAVDEGKRHKAGAIRVVMAKDDDGGGVEA